VGSDAYQFAANEHILVNKLTTMLKVPAEQLVDRLESTMNSLKIAEKEIAEIKRSSLLKEAGNILGDPQHVGSCEFWSFLAPEGTETNSVRELAQQAISRVGNSVNAVAFGAVVAAGKISAVMAVNEGGVKSGLSAQVLLRIALSELDGKGGGKDSFAQGAGTNISGLTAAISSVEAALAGH
jgi:alanyl-tRNA synthetase